MFIFWIYGLFMFSIVWGQTLGHLTFRLASAFEVCNANVAESGVIFYSSGSYYGFQGGLERSQATKLIYFLNLPKNGNKYSNDNI